MKYTKVFSLSLLLFTLFGCNQPPVASQTNNNIETSNIVQEEKSPSQKVTQKNKNNANNNIKVETTSQTQNISSQKVVTKIEKQTVPKTQNSPSKSKTIAQTEQLNLENGRIIGSANCDDDGLEDDVRVDYDGDGRADKCVVANLPIETEIEPMINETSYETVGKSLQALTQGCQESKKIQKGIEYTICKLNGQVVSASESLVEFGDGLAFWFLEGKLIAARRLHSGELYVFDYNGKLTSMFADDINTRKTKKITNISDLDRKEAEGTLYNAYKSIFKLFNL